MCESYPVSKVATGNCKKKSVANFKKAKAKSNLDQACVLRMSDFNAGHLPGYNMWDWHTQHHY